MNFKLVFTAYNRPGYLAESIRSWNFARNLTNWNTTFYIEPSELFEHVADAALTLETDVTIVANEEKFGVLVNPWQAIDHAFTSGADFVVLAEDDVAVSQDVLEFFEWTAEEYATARNVLCVNAFSADGTGLANELTQDTAFSPLIWGVWKDRWETHLRDTWDKDYSSGNLDGSEAGWDWNINRILNDKNMSVIKPRLSRSDHLGEFGGTHMTPDLYDSSRGAGFEQIRGRQRYKEV
jgi:hypothetical protein